MNRAKRLLIALTVAAAVAGAAVASSIATQRSASGISTQADHHIPVPPSQIPAA